MDASIIQQIQWNAQGLVPVVAQCAKTGQVLMLAWMNEEALRITLEKKQMVYWSRSKNALWRKGETSGQTQALKELLLDCDGDTLLAKIEQEGVACHTGRKSCFFKKLEEKNITITEEPLIDPKTLYGSNTPSGKEPGK